MKNTNMIISTALEVDDAEPLNEAQAEVEIRQLHFSPAQHGMRLDRALVDLVPEFSRSYLQQLIELGAVSLNEKITQKASQ